MQISMNSDANNATELKKHLRRSFFVFLETLPFVFFGP